MMLAAQDVVVDPDAHLVLVAGRAVVVPPRELKVLSVLLASAGRVIPRQRLTEQVWGPSGAPDTSLDVHIGRIRRRIEPDPARPRYIRTVRGLGYIFDTVKINGE